MESSLNNVGVTINDDDHITSMSEFSVYKETPRSKIFSIIRYRNHPQLFGLEYTSGRLRNYSSPDRETLLAGLLDGVRAS
ncbi:dnaJ homolog subfamily C member 13-like [Dendronephthya gigantea]|uniref:dnaJ homolog subfamily C member 13-like n=1 Tax=Dendronephthya gigantea TaxID=151771 RepID=UPI00106ACBDE|nr:dnaJ homolog subfamily C member 13-like [Dendronephthya gigantea]